MPRLARMSARPGHAPGQQPVIGHAVQLDQAAAVDAALGHRVAGSGRDVRVEPGLALGQRDLVRPDRVPGAVVGSASVTRCSTRPGTCAARAAPPRPLARFMIVSGNGRYLPKTAHDHGLGRGLGGQEGLLGGEGGAEAAGLAAGGAVEGSQGFGEAAFAPGQAGGQDGAAPVVPGEPVHGGCRRGGLIRGQGEGGQAAGRAGQRRQCRVPLPRAPEHRRPSVRPGEPEPAAQRRGQHPPGQQQRPDRVGGRVPPADRGGEREGARRRMHAGRGHGGGW